MSVTTFGIPLPIGQTLRPKDTPECPPHCIASPDNFILEYNDSSKTLNFITVENTEDELINKNIQIRVRPFSSIKVDKIYSNIRVENVFDGTSVIQSSELNAYLSISGTMDLFTVSMGTSKFSYRVMTMINSWILKFQRIVGRTSIGSNILAQGSTRKNIIYNTFLSCLQLTYNSFLSLNSINSRFDFSVYSNILCACIASMSTTLINYKINKKIDTSLSIDTKLKQLDPVFYAFYKGDEEFSREVTNMVSTIYDVLLTDYKNSLSFFGILKTLDSNAVTYMENAYDDIEITSYLFGRLGSILQLGYLSTAVENKGPTSKSALTLMFALPQKFIYV